MRGHVVLTSFLLAVSQVSSYSTLSDGSIANYPTAHEDDFNIYNQNGLLAPILIPRVPETEGSVKTRQHFANFFQQQLPEWKVEYQTSSSQTPISNGANVSFVNMIVTRDPPWADADHSSRLLLVAHYDSLWHPEGFIGAIDSAAPCAMLMHAAKSIDAALTKKWAKMRADGADGLLDELKGIQILLLDGEEAFATWSDTDSVYGARALAEEWESTVHPAMSPFRNPLQSIELFVLLDLLGASKPRIPSYYKTTHWAYQKMAALEKRLRQAGRMRTGTKETWMYEADKGDNGRWMGGLIGDDHVPFMARGVECLHIIPYDPTGFPKVWHTIADDGEHLDIPTVLDWATLTSAFAAEWLELDGFFDAQQRRSEGDAQSQWSERSEFD